MSQKLAIIDGHSLAHRAFHALPPLTTREGIPTNAAYGFTLMLMRLIEEKKPEYLAVTFDRSAPTFRHTAFEGYKATRPKMAPELRSQFDVIRRILEAFEIPVYEQDGYEADDVIGTLSCQAARKGVDVLIFTGDRDAFQLVNDRVHVMITRKGITETEEIDQNALHERFGLTPGQIPDLKGLMGDTSDNIPGVPGIGEKTALRLLHRFGTIESLIEGVDSVERPRERELLQQYADQARFSKDLATIHCDAPVEIDLDKCRVTPIDRPRITSLFSELEFHTLARRVSGGEGETGGTGSESSVPVLESRELAPAKPSDVRALCESTGHGQPIAFQFWCTGGSRLDPQPVGLAVASADQGLWISLAGDDAIPVNDWAPLFDEGHAVWCHDCKAQMAVFDHFAISPGAGVQDVMLMSYLADPSPANQELGDICKRHLGLELGGRYGDRKRLPDPLTPPGGMPASMTVESAGARIAAIMKLQPLLSERLSEGEMVSLYDEIEAPLERVLFDMEKTGVAIDVPFLAGLGREFGQRLDSLSANIYDLAGERFNLNSPKQLGTVLFERLGLPAGKKTKTGYSTDAEVLEGLAEEHPVVEKILEHRQLSKLKSTYVDALPQLVAPGSGRVHTTFNQTVTATGRLSSTDPNLQNIPIRTDLGGQIRDAFVPGVEGWRILAADYSQIELRIMAHMSGDPVLSEAFKTGEDIHRRTAAEIFGIPLEEVDERRRDQAKAVNFGVIYGISGFGLARNTGVSRSEAEMFIKRYFERYSGVARFVDETIQRAREQGFVTTMFKRRRYLPDLMAANRSVRAFAERTARNTPVQGSAADIIKLAMIRVHEEMAKRRMQARMLLQVHDELVFETPDFEIDALAQLVRETMERVCEMNVPLIADVKVGTSWGDAKRSVKLKPKE